MIKMELYYFNNLHNFTRYRNHTKHKCLTFLNLNIYVLYILLWIKYWLMWFESLLVFILFKKKKKNIPTFPEFGL